MKSGVDSHKSIDFNHLDIINRAYKTFPLNRNIHLDEDFRDLRKPGVRTHMCTNSGNLIYEEWDGISFVGIIFYV